VARYEESAGAMKAALKADRNALRFTKSIAAAADSLVHLGNVKAAQQLMALHVQQYPGAHQDSDYLRSEKVVTEAMKVTPAQ
jgi:hypothetical protein